MAEGGIRKSALQLLRERYGPVYNGERSGSGEDFTEGPLPSGLLVPGRGRALRQFSYTLTNRVPVVNDESKKEETSEIEVTKLPLNLKEMPKEEKSRQTEIFVEKTKERAVALEETKKELKEACQSLEELKKEKERIKERMQFLQENIKKKGWRVKYLKRQWKVDQEKLKNIPLSNGNVGPASSV